MKPLFGLIGKKLAHSYSVPIHHEMGNFAYRLFELPPDELESFLRQENLGGVNITIPYKTEVMKFCDTISKEAQEIGSINTIVNKDGKLTGYNTDKYGFEYMLRHKAISLENKKVLVLGSGGASKTAVFCSKLAGAKEIVIISRSGENNYSNIQKHRDADVIVNTTPVGMFPDNYSSPVSLDSFERLEAVVDLVYNPLKTALIIEAEKRNIKTTGGLTMLTAQAKMAEELFFDTFLDDGLITRITDNLYKKASNIVLIGMPGSGKSTVGKILSLISEKEAFDTDELITQKAGRTPKEIITSDGESVFRKIESEVIREVSKESGKIIITGGGAVTRKDNYIPLHQNGRIYEIKRDINTLPTDDRPLSKDFDTLLKMQKERQPMYEFFRDAFVLIDSSPQEVANKIWSDFNENTCY